jgi:diguanylate cyclase (GGDEF)-like protein
MRDNITIAVVAPIQPEDFFDLLWQGVWEATFDLSSFGVEVQNVATERGDVGEQRKILEILLDSRPDAIALLPAHVCALNDLIDQHALRGTPVITFHGDAPSSQRVAFVRPDLRQSGVLAGEVLAKLMHGRGRVLSFPGSLEEFHLAQRYQGFLDALANYQDRIEETCCSFDPDAPLEATRKVVQSFGRVAGYYVGNGDLVGIAAVIERLEPEPGVQTPCVGFSNTECVRPFLERGVVSAVIDEKRYQLGYFAVQKAYEAALKRDEHAPLANVQIASTVVFAANASAAVDTLDSAFELLLRQRTDILVSYKKRLEDANAKLLDLAVTDPLTGLYNRRKFEEALKQEVARALRYGSVSMLMIDLDRFKGVNDRFGHRTGDDVLKAVAQVMQACCRATDTCARLGGDEFAILLPHSNFSAAEVVRDRIQQQIARLAIPTPEGRLTIHLSIGLATLPGDVNSATEFIAAADVAMYQAKQAARSTRAPADESNVVKRL